jgi:NADH dehydrogenase/NADH:ubiquinone oxidoreductase subunit G
MSDPDDSKGMISAVNLASRKGLSSEGTIRLIVLKPFGNSAGAWRLGLAADRDGPTDRKWRGALMLIGEELEPGKEILSALTGTEFLAVISPYFPAALSEKAHILFPKPLRMEEGGTYASLEGRETAFKKRVLSPPKGVKDSWRTLSALADRTGILSGFSRWSDLKKEAKQSFCSSGR